MQDFNEYSEFANRMWFSHPGSGIETDRVMNERDLTIMGLGLCGEAGEVTEKIKKVIRDGYTDTDGILKELGDVIFYAVQLARFFGFKASDILDANVTKLESRRARGVERGSGDNR